MNDNAFNSCDGLDVLQAVQECGKLFLKKPPDVVGARDLIEPYADCTSFSSRREPKHLQHDATMRQMVLMALGDIAYYENKPNESAEYYRRAFELDGRYLIADMYARVVVEHDLADHYASAAEAVHQAQVHSRQSSFLLHVFGYVYWFLFYVIPHPRLWREYRRGLKFQREVVRRTLGTNNLGG